VCPLQIYIQVDLNYTVADSLLKLLLSQARSAVKNKENRLVLGSSNLLLDVLLVLIKRLRVELDCNGCKSVCVQLEFASNRRY
jgi:hypothetical protein